MKKVLFILVSFVLFGCVTQNKPKTILPMADYLSKKSNSNTIINNPNCLSADLAPPTALPSQIKFVGYFLGNATSPASTSIGGFTSSLDELVGQGNGITISYLPQEALAPTINPDELFISKIQVAKARGFKIVVEIPIIFFDFNFSKMRFEVKSLSPNYRNNWAHFKNLINPYLDSIVGLYPYDEPYWAALNQGVPANDMKQFLDEIAITIKSDLPSMPLIFMEAFPMIKADLQIPQGWDWIGMDCYGSFDNCGNPGDQHSIPEYYNILKSKMNSNQKLVVIPEAFLFTETPTLDDEIALVRRSQQFLAWAATEPRIIALAPFIYRNLAEEHITGAREMCPVREFYKSYLTQARIQLSQTSSIAIACPTSLVAGSSGTCTANYRGNLVSGYWTQDGVKVAGSDNLTSFTWNNIPAGTYRIQGMGKDNLGNTILSNLITVTVVPKPALTITCPTSLRAHSSGTCSATYVGALASGYWTVNGSKVANSDNLTSFTWNDIPAGNYRVQGIAKDNNGNTVLSNIINVAVY